MEGNQNIYTLKHLNIYSLKGTEAASTNYFQAHNC